MFTTASVVMLCRGAHARPLPVVAHDAPDVDAVS